MTAATLRRESADLLVGSGEAVFSADGVYRYQLTRTWGPDGRLAVWIMLNPSTADAGRDDPTIHRCTKFTRAWGLDGLVVVNLFALRATDPGELRGHPDPVGPDNNLFIGAAARSATVLVAAWGAHAFASDRAAAVMTSLPPGNPLQCLGVTDGGHPKHPLARGRHRVPDGAPLAPFRSAVIAAEYAAPASQVLTELHRPDPTIPPVTAGPDPSSGVTVCGLPMLTAEAWMDVERREGDQVCRACDGQPEIAEEVLF